MKKEEKTTVVSVRMPIAMRDELKRIADREYTTMNPLIRQAIAEYLQKKERV